MTTSELMAAALAVATSAPVFENAGTIVIVIQQDGSYGLGVQGVTLDAAQTLLGMVAATAHKTDVRIEEIGASCPKDRS